MIEVSRSWGMAPVGNESHIAGERCDGHTQIWRT